jgi:hypothetical protein
MRFPFDPAAATSPYVPSFPKGARSAPGGYWMRLPVGCDARWRGVAAQRARDSVRPAYTFALHGWSPFGR